MLTIRLQRIGKKHQPGFRVVVSERRSKLGGPPVEDLGSYDPRTKKAAVAKERVLHWLNSGAKASPTVHNLLVKSGAISGPRVAVKIKKKAVTEAPVDLTTESSVVAAATESGEATTASANSAPAAE